MGLVVHNDKIENKEEFIKVCPFGAMEVQNGDVIINSACKMCKVCVRKSKHGEVEFVEEKLPTVDKSKWSGITVYVDHENGKIHPVTLELIGKARELAKKVNQPVYCVFFGSGIEKQANELLHYGVDSVFVYDDPALRSFQNESYTAAFEDFVNRNHPCAILVGATPVGRQLAPRVAARFRTGLTADCTILDIDKNTDLIQIRPAFGGNIMAQICTPRTRPQMATVRYKVMNAPARTEETTGRVVDCKIDAEKLRTHVQVLDVKPKQKVASIENAEVLVAAGRGIKSKEDLAMVQELADLLGGELACTRPLVESGWVEARRQVGLSGRTVRPKLIITCGISGAVQFSAGMKSAETIVSINSDEKAPIFNVAHIGLVGDVYEIIPQLIKQLKQGKEA
ncbi:MAG TPA: electron transfer flavoprotein subunit alpha [Ruminococcaceae bacterium]|nr:electron transfer flavoprotein subunit alpha [Oscillospiraceae bacterium]